MPTLGVLLDANVLIPAALRDTLLRAAEAGLYQPHWTEEILDEVRRNLVRRGMTGDAQARRLLAAVRDAFPDAMVRDYEAIVAQMTNDPRDRHVLAAAASAKARIVVTNNIRDFPNSALAPWGIQAQIPDHFLNNLFDADPDRTLEIIRHQAADLTRPPVRIEALLAILAVHVPAFSRKVRAVLVTGAE